MIPTVELQREKRKRFPLMPPPAILCMLCLVALFLCARGARAVPACPEVMLVHQPDGTPFWARRLGDERWHVTETEDGYTIVEDRESGFWFYAVEKDGLLAKSGYLVGKVSPKPLGLKKHLRPERRLKEQKRGVEGVAFLSEAKSRAKADGLSTAASATPAAKPRTIKSLVILARFADHISYHTQDQFDRLFNESGYSVDKAAGSIRDYYRDVSAGQLTIDSTVSDWVSLPRNESFYGADGADGEDSNPRQLVRDAVRALDVMGFDFSPFDADRDGEIDMLTIIHSGLAQEFAGNPSDCIWSQVVYIFPAETVDGKAIRRAALAPERRRSTTLITRIGVICHESGHLLGLPDLYDTDGSSSGIGYWGIMGAGSWGGDGHSAQRPVHFCAWSKVKLEWVSPTKIDGSDSPITIPAIEDVGSYGIYKVTREMPDDEYLLIENRRKTGYDLNLPGAGLLVWHIDDNQPGNDDEPHYMVGLLQADGLSDLENGTNRGDAGDPFPGTSNRRVLDATTSPSTASYYSGPTYIGISSISDASATMTFDISTLTDLYSEHFSDGLPPDWQVVDDKNDAYTWTDRNPGSRSDPNWSGTFMIADSDAAGWRFMDEQLISSEYDCSPYVHTRLQFNHYFRASSGQTGDVDVRVDGGKWQNVARYKFDDDSGTVSIDISSFADGRSSVQMRWHFYNISYGWYWGIDDVAIRGELPANLPPQIAITSIAQRTDGSGRVEIRFIGTDPEGDPANWASEHCRYASAPYETWQPLTFDTADPASTAIEPMPFTVNGKKLVAVVDVSGWDGLYKVKLRVTNGVTSNPAVISNEFITDTAPAEVISPTHLETTPSSGSTSVTAYATWSDANRGATWFQLRLNDGAWSVPLKGSPYGSSDGARFSPLSLDGDDYLTVQSYHVDLFGNTSEQSVSPTYYVRPLKPSFPTFRDVEPNLLVVVVNVNSAERGDVDYAVYCSTVGQYLDWQTGLFVEAPSWGDHSQWGGSAGTTVTGLKSKTTYTFQVAAANPHDHDSRSSFSLTGSRTTANTPPAIEILGPRAVYAGQSIELLIVGSDADGDEINISVLNKPPDATLTRHPDGTATFLWPNSGVDLSQDVTFSAADGSDETSMDVSLILSRQPFEIAAIGKSVSPHGEPTTVITWYALPGVTYSIFRSAHLLFWESVASGISLPQGSTAPAWLSYQEEIGSVPSARYYRLGM